MNIRRRSAASKLVTGKALSFSRSACRHGNSCSGQGAAKLLQLGWLSGIEGTGNELQVWSFAQGVLPMW